MEPEQRNNVVNRAGVVATVVLLAFAFTGQALLDYCISAWGLYG